MKIEEKLITQFYEAIVDKLRQNNDDSSYFLKYDMNSFSKKIQRNDFLRAMESLQIRLNEQDASMLSRALDPENTGFYDLSGLLHEISKIENKNNNQDRFHTAYERGQKFTEIEEKALRSVLDDIYSFCKKSLFKFNV